MPDDTGTPDDTDLSDDTGTPDDTGDTGPTDCVPETEIFGDEIDQDCDGSDAVCVADPEREVWDAVVEGDDAEAGATALCAEANSVKVLTVSGTPFSTMAPLACVCSTTRSRRSWAFRHSRPAP